MKLEEIEVEAYLYIAAIYSEKEMYDEALALLKQGYQKTNEQDISTEIKKIEDIFRNKLYEEYYYTNITDHETTNCISSRFRS